MTEQRRHFSRIPFTGAARLECEHGGLDCQVLDLSLKGALLNMRGDLPEGKAPCVLRLDLGEDAQVVMRGHVAHREGSHVGLACEDIDLDSITHLRRLLELNLGDTALLERELAALIDG